MHIIIFNLNCRFDSLVIQGLDSCFALRLDIFFMHGCMFVNSGFIWQAKHDKSGLSWKSPIESQ